MSLPLDHLEPEVRRRLATSLVRLIRSSPFRAPDRWRHAILVCTPGRNEVLHRLVFAAQLRQDGLTHFAHEVASRPVRAGEVLAYLLADDEEQSGVSVVVIDLRSELRAIG